MLRILILEDDKERVRQFVKKYINNELDYTDKADEAIKLIKNNTYDYIYLDHDLGGKQMEFDEDNCGMNVAEHIEKNPLPESTKVIIHSYNAPAAQRMLKIIPRAKYAPGIWASRDKNDLQ